MAFQGKGIMFMEWNHQGWTEIYYPKATGYAAAQTAMTNLLTVRLTMLSPDVNVVQMTVYDIGNPPNRSSAQMLSAPEPGAYIVPGTPAIKPDLAITMRCFDNSFHTFRHFIRGLPGDGFVGGSETYQPAAAFITAFAAFKAAYTVNAVERHKIAVGPPPVYQFVDVVTIGQNYRFSIRKAGRPFAQFRGRRMIA